MVMTVTLFQDKQTNKPSFIYIYIYIGRERDSWYSLVLRILSINPIPGYFK